LLPSKLCGLSGELRTASGDPPFALFIEGVLTLIGECYHTNDDK
jgi:hypothetical protein